MMKSVLILEFILLFLSSCSTVTPSENLPAIVTSSVMASMTPKAISTATYLTQSSTHLIRQTVTEASSTATGALTLTLIPDSSPSPVATITPPTFLPLSQMIVTQKNIVDEPYFVDDFLPSVSIVRDDTALLKEHCELDCVRNVWNGWHSQHLTISMWRTESREAAHALVLELYKELGPPNFEYRDLERWLDPPGDAWLFTDHYSRVILSMSQGPIVLSFILKPDPSLDDAMAGINTIIVFATIQLSKLEQAGYSP